MKRADVIGFILVGLFITCLNFIVSAQDCLPKLIKASKDTTFTLTDSNLLLIERPDNDTYEVTISFIKKGPVVTTVNNTELIFTGSWEHPAGATYTVSHSNQVGATAKYSFTGNRVEVISDLDPSHGKIGYTINSGTEKFVDLYRATRLNGQVVINEIVPPGFNTITFKVVSNTVLIDYLTIHK